MYIIWSHIIEEKVKSVTEKSQNYKATGGDNIPTEATKVCKEI